MQCNHCIPKNPLASTFEKPTVGVGGERNPIKDFVRPPFCRNVDTLGVDRAGKGTGPAVSVVSVIVEGVRVFMVGDGGKRKRVCEGVGSADEVSTTDDARRRTLFRSASGGGMGLPDSVLRRAANVEGFGSARGAGMGAGAGVGSSCSMTMGEGGTVGRTLSDIGRFFLLLRGGGGMLKVDRMAVRGGGGMLKEVFHTGAEGRGSGTGCEVALAVSGA